MIVLLRYARCARERLSFRLGRANVEAVVVSNCRGFSEAKAQSEDLRPAAYAETGRRRDVRRQSAVGESSTEHGYRAPVSRSGGANDRGDALRDTKVQGGRIPETYRDGAFVENRIPTPVPRTFANG